MACRLAKAVGIIFQLWKLNGKINWTLTFHLTRCFIKWNFKLYTWVFVVCQRYITLHICWQTVDILRKNVKETASTRRGSIQWSLNKAHSVRKTWHWVVKPLLQWKGSTSRILRVCVSSLSCPVCNEHAPYCHMCSIQLYNIFPHHLINGTIFGKNLLNLKKLPNTKCVFWLSLQLLSETFLILRRTERDVIVKLHRALCKLPNT
jgi:hypothetical protein